MNDVNLYEFIGLPFSASTEEIDAAIVSKYNEIRRLVTHHDPLIVNQANFDLQQIDHARLTLLDPKQKALYDSSLGLSITGGLADPQAVLQRFNLATTIPTPPASSGTDYLHPITPAISERTDAWICHRCRSANQIGTRYCQKCGNEIAITCPKCKSLQEKSTIYCQECGININDTTLKIEEEKKYLAFQEEEKKRVQIETMARIGPIATKSVDAWNVTRIGCILSIIPFFGLFSLPLWAIGLIKARNALSYSQVPGDTEYRAKAKKAFWWAVISLVISFLLIAFYVFFQFADYFYSTSRF